MGLGMEIKGIPHPLEKPTAEPGCEPASLILQTPMKMILSLLTTFLLVGAAIAADAPAPAPGPKINLLVISKTAGYRHQAIPTGIKALVEIAQEAKWGVTATEDTSLVTPEFLGHFDVVIFLMTTKTIFTAEEKAAIEAFVKGGKGLLTIHTGADTEYDWPWYNRQLGVKFLGHPPAQKARLVIEDRSHPATSFFPAADWTTTDNGTASTGIPGRTSTF